MRTSLLPLERRVEAAKALCHLLLRDCQLDCRVPRRLIRADGVPLLLGGLVDARPPQLAVRGHAGIAALRLGFQDQDEP